jgi:hypothetical protein
MTPVMTIDDIRALMLRALEAAKYGAAVDPSVRDAVAAGRSMDLTQLAFDSLAWMEFCISVEIETRLELTTNDIAAMTTIADIEAWLSARLEDVRLPG